MTRRYLPVVLSMWLIVAGTLQAQIISSFESDTEGWVVRDANCSNYAQVLASHTPAWQPAGGDSGGWVQHHDSTSYCSFFAAPAAYLGDRSAYVGGALEFSLSSTESDWQDSDVVVLIGAGLVVCQELPIIPPLPPAWRHYVVSLQASGFTYNNENGTVVSTTDFAAVLADLDVLLLPAEFGAQVEETVGLDSVWLHLPGTPVAAALPAAARLLGARPNPFNPVTTVTFDLPEARPVRLTVHDARGRLICILRDGQIASAGRDVTWQGRDDRGATQPSGTYVIRLEVGEFSATVRVLMLK